MSNMTLVNRADDATAVRVAIYKRPIMQTALGTIAWRVISLPAGASWQLWVESAYEIEARIHGQFPEVANDEETGPVAVPFDGAGMDCVIEGGPALHILPRAISAGAVNYGEVRVENRTRHEVWVKVLKDSLPLYWSFVVMPGQTRAEDLRQPFYLAVVPNDVGPGDRLDDVALLSTQTPVVEGGVVVIRGSAGRHVAELFRDPAAGQRLRSC
ncbi:hypothetical protein [Derxia lacustris]|uniref:hypothetical protein n=1 Tax=Derxia lacustris TaxID=764842 RepID=UPI000A16CC6B|nr:hypothetical protein [Derxia lacustris]